MKLTRVDILYGVTAAVVIGMLVSIKSSIENIARPALRETSASWSKPIPGTPAASLPATPAVVPGAGRMTVDEFRALGDYVAARVNQERLTNVPAPVTSMHQARDYSVAESATAVTVRWRDESGVEQSYTRPHERLFAELTERVNAGEMTPEDMVGQLQRWSGTP